MKNSIVHWAIRCLAPIWVAAAVACGSDDDGPAFGGEPTETGGAGGVGGTGPGGSGGSAGASGGASGGAGTAGTAGDGGGGAGRGLAIQFDYRFDTKGMFNDPTRRAALEAAAEIWGRVLVDDFSTVPAGTEVLTRDPEHPHESGTVFPIDYDIDDVVVFVGFSSEATTDLGASYPSAALESVTYPDMRRVLNERYVGSDFEPWTGWLTFFEHVDWFYDSTPDTADDIPPTQVDFITVALHELGHILGFGSSAAFDALVQGDTFVGPAAMAVIGGPVPLLPDHQHFPTDLLVDGSRSTMDGGDPPGARFPPTRLDKAALADLGYELAP